ncbi:hypothetical protein WICMUC_003708 [Wickerhamomyces mucosus]|uniref:Transcriptional coactivator HFI1/ADA1 n=1 Tax=Wickerhamomyces mucosus TaxID=1378264 RepID=A0A9P8PJB9_9ASCO|nr:hypothetical protein WICMUC_003708 [Wickerhamomyces mucosus]
MSSVIVSGNTSVQNNLENGVKNSPGPTSSNINKLSGNKLKRLEINSVADELFEKLGRSDWDKYQVILNSFLIGKLSRIEFVEQLNEIFQNHIDQTRLKKLHNQVILINLTNALRDTPNTDILDDSKFTLSKYNNSKISKISNFSKFGGNNKAKTSQYEKLKKTVMNLPIRERFRIKSITRESGKRSMANSSLTLTRQSLLPKIPYSNDKERLNQTVEWSQDISHSIQTQLSTETFCLPDNENLMKRCLGIAREHGLTGIVEKDSIELIYLALEIYLKNILESSIDTLRFRKSKYDDNDIFTTTTLPNKTSRKLILTNEDIVDTLKISPFLLEPSGPVYKLHSLNSNDDTYVEKRTKIDDILIPRDEVKIINEAAKSPVVVKKEVPETKLEINNVSSNNELSHMNGNDYKKPTSLGDNKSIIPNQDELSENSGNKDELNWLIHDILAAGW